MARLILTVPGEDAPIGGNSDVIGTSTGGEVITVVNGTVRFDPSFNLGGDTIDMPGNAATFTVARSGSNAVISGNGTTVEIPIGLATEIRFDDTSLSLRVTGSGANQTAVLGNQTLTNDPVTINPNTPPPAALAAAEDMPTMAELTAPDDGFQAAQFDGLKSQADIGGLHLGGVLANHAFVIHDFIV